MSPDAWRVRVMPPAHRQLARLPESAAAAVIETLRAIGENPHRLGKPLALELKGRFAARRGPYRVIYEIVESERLVLVVAIAHRRDVYRRR